MKAKNQFKVGHLYSIDYDDHYSVDRSCRSAEDGEPCVLRQRGLALVETAKMIVLEHNLHVSDKADKRSDRHAILKSAIIAVRHYGAEER